MSETMNLEKRMLAIAAELTHIEKDKKNTFHGYEYASEYAIKAAVQPLLVKHGVHLAVSSKVTSRHEVTTAKGATEYQVGIELDYSFANADDRTQTLTGTMAGFGQDSGDKAVYKAITGALKYALTTNFLIPTGDDPEQDSAHNAPQRPAATSNAPQVPRQQAHAYDGSGKVPEGTHTLTVSKVEGKTSAKGKDYTMVHTNKGQVVNFGKAAMQEGKTYHANVGQYGIESAQEVSTAQENLSMDEDFGDASSYME